VFKWNFIQLDEVCTFEKGKTGLAKAVEGKYILVATGKDRKSCDNYQFDTKAVCIPLVSSTGHGHASLKNVHYQEGKFALGTILVAVIPKDENILNAQFLHLYLSRLKDTILVPLMTGAANVTLTVTKLKKVKVPLPPIEEQLRIVSLFNRMDTEQAELTDEITHQQTLLKKLRQSILQEAIEGKLTASWREKNPTVESASVLLQKIKKEKEKLFEEKKIKKQKPLPPINKNEIPFDIPDGWEWCRLGDISNVKVGSTPSRAITEYWNGNINWVSSGEVANNFIYSTKESITEKGFNSTSLIIYPKGSVLVAMIGQGKTRGQTSILKINATINQNVAGIVFEYNNIISEYIWNFFLSRYELTRSGASGGNQPALNGTKIKNTLLPLPPLKEQKQIVKKVESLFKICDELESQINSSKVNAQMMMQSVLKEAFEDK